MNISSPSLALSVPQANSAKSGTAAPAPLASIASAPAGIVEISSQAQQSAQAGLRSPLSNMIWGSGPSRTR